MNKIVFPMWCAVFMIISTSLYAGEPVKIFYKYLDMTSFFPPDRKTIETQSILYGEVSRDNRRLKELEGIVSSAKKGQFDLNLRVKIIYPDQNRIIYIDKSGGVEDTSRSGTYRIHEDKIARVVYLLDCMTKPRDNTGIEKDHPLYWKIFHKVKCD